MWLLVRKYEEATIQRYKLAAYPEFLFLQKILLYEAHRDKIITGNYHQERVPLISVESLKRVEVYDDELDFPSKSSKISLV
jgi:hypothetical protein